MTTEITRIVLRRGTAAAWTAANPVLLSGESGLETDTKRTKMGDGATIWAALPYDLDTASANSTYLTYTGTNPAAIPTVKPSGDVRDAVWEFSHDAPRGYIFHLLSGLNMSNDAAMIGMGIDAGGVGLFVNNKATGNGIKIDQNNTITSATAYAVLGHQMSTVAPLIHLAQDDRTAATLRIVSAETVDPLLGSLVIVSPGAKGGVIQAMSGNIHWKSDIATHDGGVFRARQYEANSDNTQTKVKQNAVEFATFTGSTGQFWHKQIRGNGTTLIFEVADTTNPGSGPDFAPVYTTVFEVARNQIGFFAKAPVSQPAHPVTLADVITALTNLGLTA